MKYVSPKSKIAAATTFVVGPTVAPDASFVADSAPHLKAQLGLDTAKAEEQAAAAVLAAAQTPALNRVGY